MHHHLIKIKAETETGSMCKHAPVKSEEEGAEGIERGPVSSAEAAALALLPWGLQRKVVALWWS